MQLTLQRADPRSEVAALLMREMLQEETLRYSDLGDDSDSFRPSDVLVPGSAFIIAYVGERPVGCGAVRPITPDSAEIKRMYVAPEVRCRGIGGAILNELERLAVGFGYRILRLETGNRQPEAIALYETHEYRRVPAFGEHVGDPVSVCFEKHIAGHWAAEQDDLANGGQPVGSETD